MPAAETQQRRAGLPLLPGLLWAGVGLAPIAALLVMFSGESVALMRVAVLLAAVAVVLIGVSMALRRDPDSVRGQVEDMIFEELDILRDDLREDITTAARATHKSLSERVVKLQESVDSLRGQFDHLRVQVERGAVPPQPVPQQARPAPPVPPATGAPGVVPGHGVVRHTETVKVTTRQTIVDQNDPRRGAGTGTGTGTVYGSRPSAQAPVPAPRRGSVSPDDEPEDTGSWTEKLLRQRLGEDRYGDAGFGDSGRFGAGRQGETHYGEDRYAEGLGGRRRAPDLADDRLSDIRAGDRWASVRSDDHGRELRMGERRTELHAGHSGTEMRIEDRWAAVRRDEARRPEPRREPEPEWDRGRDRETDWGRESQRASDGGRGSAYWSESRPEEPRTDPGPYRADRRGGQPALPATPSEPGASSWVQGWSAHPEPVSERARRSREDDDEDYRWGGRDDDGSPARSPRARSAGYDTGEERWR